MIKVKKLSFRYPSRQVDTIKDLDFEIEAGEIFGFLGPSGSGKSTTQKILFKLLPGYSGDLFFDGKPLDQWDRSFYEKIGVSFELPNHYLKLTARENLQFFNAFYQRKSKSWMKWVEQVGLEKDLDIPVGNFSKGMKMRLNFVRALLHDPEVIFLDEPTSGLDPINAGKIKNAIRELKQQGKTIFLTTHNMFDADQLCDRVALLHEGKIITLDAPGHLKLQHGKKRVKVTLNGKQEEHYFEFEQLGSNQEFIEMINQPTLSTIHSEEATLEEVFIKLTGAQLL